MSVSTLQEGGNVFQCWSTCSVEPGDQVNHSGCQNKDLIRKARGGNVLPLSTWVIFVKALTKHNEGRMVLELWSLFLMGKSHDKEFACMVFGSRPVWQCPLSLESLLVHRHLGFFWSGKEHCDEPCGQACPGHNSTWVSLCSLSWSLLRTWVFSGNHSSALKERRETQSSQKYHHCVPLVCFHAIFFKLFVYDLACFLDFISHLCSLDCLCYLDCCCVWPSLFSDLLDLNISLGTLPAFSTSAPSHALHFYSANSVGGCFHSHPMENL